MGYSPRPMTDSPVTRTQERAGFVPVYAIAAGLAAAVPMPFVDTFLARTARGSAMRRVASRHGLTLSPEARKVLGGIELPKAASVSGYKVARTVLQRYLFPMLPISRVEDGLATLGSAMLFDSYLRHRPVAKGTMIDEAMAKTIRTSIDAALLYGVADLARTVPEAAKRLATESYAAVKTRDAEGRARHEALVDHLLDAIADVPEGMLTTLELRLEQELARGEGDR